MKQAALTNFFKKSTPSSKPTNTHSNNELDTDCIITNISSNSDNETIIPDTPQPKLKPIRQSNLKKHLDSNPIKSDPFADFSAQSSNHSNAKSSTTTKSKKTLSLLRKRSKAELLDGLNYSPLDQEIAQPVSYPSPNMLAISRFQPLGIENKKPSIPTEDLNSKRCKVDLDFYRSKAKSTATNPKIKSIAYSNDEMEALDDILNEVGVDSASRKKSETKKSVSNAQTNSTECFHNEIDDILNEVSVDSTSRKKSETKKSVSNAQTNPTEYYHNEIEALDDILNEVNVDSTSRNKSNILKHKSKKRVSLSSKRLTAPPLLPKGVYLSPIKCITETTNLNKSHVSPLQETNKEVDNELKDKFYLSSYFTTTGYTNPAQKIDLHSPSAKTKKSASNLLNELSNSFDLDNSSIIPDTCPEFCASQASSISLLGLKGMGDTKSCANTLTESDTILNDSEAPSKDLKDSEAPSKEEKAINEFSFSESLCDAFNTSFSICEMNEEIPRRYQRCRVISVTSDRDALYVEMQVVLGIQKLIKVKLGGFWYDTPIAIGDICHIIDAQPSLESPDWLTINDKAGFLVVSPDILVSGTTIVQSMACQRRSVLQHFYSEMGPGPGTNKPMLVGSIVHELFQKIAMLTSPTEMMCKQISEELLSSKRFILDTYDIGLSEGDMEKEIDIYIPQIIKWMRDHTQRSVSGLPILDSVQDIEENIWSATFGVKGKLDLTVRTRQSQLAFVTPQSSSHSVIPMELKTGRSTFSDEHIGQVILYTMMLEDRIDAGVKEGWLVYLKDGQSRMVSANHGKRRGLIQIRNQLVSYLKAVFPSDKTGTDLGKEGASVSTPTYFAELPPVVHNKWLCSRCPQITKCALYSDQSKLDTVPDDHPIKSLLPAAISHLSPNHIAYFLKWSKLLLMEHIEQEIGNETTLKHIIESNKKDAIRTASLQECVTFESSYLATFTFTPNMEFPALNQFVVGEPLIVSSSDGKQIALVIGSIYSLSNTSLQLICDRKIDIRFNPYRLDKYRSNKILQINLGILSTLMSDTDTSKFLRKVIIDKFSPTFLPTLSKAQIAKVKSIMKPLNKAQRCCILKVLMANDYVIVNGYPGSGKTATIVALIRVLLELGGRILLASYTHSAVDNVLLKLVKFDVDFLRIGRSDRTRTELRSYCLEEQMQDIHSVAELEILITHKRLVATTCLSTSHPALSRQPFDTVIVDEAGQILQPTCIAPLLHTAATSQDQGTKSGAKFVLVGDQHQLPPLVRCNQARCSGLGTSLLSSLTEVESACVQLNVQYRMNSVILRLCNNLVYQGQIKCASDQVANASIMVQESVQICSNVPSWMSPIYSSNLTDSVIFLDTSKLLESDSFIERKSDNVGEAMIVAHIVSTFLTIGVAATDLGIIAPFRNQVSLIKSTLTSSTRSGGAAESSLEDRSPLCDVEVNTVDQYQGRDKSIIIISFTRSRRDIGNGPTEDESSGGILHDIRRLNVAISRAQHKLIMIGCQTVLAHYAPLKGLFDILESNQVIAFTKLNMNQLHIE